MSVHFDQFDFAPKASSHLTVGLELGLTHDEGTSKHPTSGAKPAEPPHPLGKTFLCKDGTYSEAKHSQGACSSHGGIGQKLDPNNSEGLDPETGPDSLWLRLQQGPQFTVGQFTIPLGIDHVLDTTWEPERSRPAHERPFGERRCQGRDDRGRRWLPALRHVARNRDGNPDRAGRSASHRARVRRNTRSPGVHRTRLRVHQHFPTAAGQPSSYPVGGSQCRTVYFINTQTQTLQGFWTSSSDYHTEHGTTVGMSAAAAQQREGVNVVEGCGIGITLGDNTTVAHVLIDIPPAAGGSPQSTDTVSYIGSDSQQNSVGVLFC